ncbi:MAG TPA: ROK family protein [Catalimonadaceae bacterium]|nr:ROK family protein [Catalimonadaceae bacterium]
MEPVFGIDLGGTKTEGVVLPFRGSTEPICRLRVPTEATKGYDHIIHQIRTLTNLLETGSGVKPSKIGICTPGTSDPGSGLHKNSNTTCLNDRPFRKDLEKALGMRVSMANDANCFALAEATLGIVKEKMPDAKVVFGIIMGTGVGGGLVFDGKVWNGAHGIGGEWGHNFLDESGGPCYCGRSGCVETILSGPSLERFYAIQSGSTKSLQEIVLGAHNQADPVAILTMERMIHFFGKAVGTLINILDPDAIVIGGGVGNIDMLYTKGVTEVEKYLFNPKLETMFFKPKLGDSAGVFGAAML